MKNSKTVLIDKNPGRNSQTFGIARILNTDLDLIHEPSIGVVGNKGDSQCYLGVEQKVKTIHEKLSSDFEGRFKIILVPNITNICYGRGVGYKLEEIVLPEQIQNISATKIRKQLRDQGKLK